MKKTRSAHRSGRARLSIEQLEHRDVPATFNLFIAGAADLSVTNVSWQLNIGGSISNVPYNPGDSIQITGSTGNDHLTIRNNAIGSNVDLSIQYDADGGMDTLTLPTRGNQFNLVASESASGGAFVEAFTLLSSPGEFPSVVDPGLRITADSIEIVEGSSRSDIFNVSGTVAAKIVGGPASVDAPFDTVVFSNDSILVATAFAEGTIESESPLVFDFGSYTTSLSFNLANGRLSVTNANDEPIFQGQASHIHSILGSAANDRFVISGFGVPGTESILPVMLSGGEGDDTFVLVDAPDGATQTVDYRINGGVQSFTGSPTPFEQGDTFQIQSSAVANVFNLADYDRELPAPPFPGLLISLLSPTTSAQFRFAGIESFEGGDNADSFISSRNELGSTGHLFRGNGGGDSYAVWNQAPDHLFIESDDYLVSIDQTLDTFSTVGLPRPSADPRRTGLSNDLFFTQQKRSIADNDRVITPENQHQVYTAFVTGLFLDLLGRTPSLNDLDKWVNYHIETRKLSSLDIAREFVLGNVDNLIVRDFYLAFFSGDFSDQISVANPTEAAAQAEQSFGLKAASIANGIVLSDQYFVDLVLGELFVDEPSLSFITESTTLLRQRALNSLTAGGTWEDAIITIVNSEEYLRVAVRSLAVVDPSFADIIPPLPETSIVKSAVPMLSVFKDGQWKVDADQLSLNVIFETQIQFGVAIDQPVLGDWNGDGLPDLGVYREGVWYLDTNGIVGWQGDDTTINFGVQIDTPVVGDWNGDGIDDLGVYRQGTWYLDTNGTRGWQGNDSSADFGVAADNPVVADWNGDKRSDLGVIRNGNTFYADTNGTRGWQGNDSTKIFSKAILQPVGGDFNFNGFGDVSQFGAPGTELAAFDFAPVGPSALPLQASIRPGETPVAWSRRGRPLSPSNSQYELLIPTPVGGGGFGGSSGFGLQGLSLMSPIDLSDQSRPKNQPAEPIETLSPSAIDDAFDEHVLPLDA